MSLPTENLALIVQFAVRDEDGTLISCGAVLSLISGFSLASRHFRQIVLREIFKEFYVTNASDLQHLERFPDMYKWIRFFHCPVQIATQMTKEQFARFTWLREIHLWGPSFGLSSVLQRMPDNVQEMTLPFEHDNNHYEVLTAASRFHACTRVRVARSRFEFHPASDVPTGDVPPHHFTYSSIAAELLTPMRSLQILEIDHYLTDTECVEFHNSQCPWSSASSAFCPTCWEKFGQQTANAEIACTIIMAKSLKSLEMVVWKSWFTANAEGQSRVLITREVRDGCEEVRVSRERDAIEAGWNKRSLKLRPSCKN